MCIESSSTSVRSYKTVLCGFVIVAYVYGIIAKQFVTNENRGRINGRPLVSCESNVSAAICIFLQLCTCSVKSVHQIKWAMPSKVSTVQNTHYTNCAGNARHSHCPPLWTDMVPYTYVLQSCLAV